MEDRYRTMQSQGAGYGESAAAVAAPLPAGDWDKLTSLAATQDYAAGVELFGQGELPADVYILDKGLVKLTNAGEDGLESIVGLRSPGSILGAASAFVERPHPAAAVTLTPCLLRNIPLRRFLALAQTDISLSWYLHLMHSREVYEQSCQLVDMKRLSARQRLEQLVWQMLSAAELANAGEHVRLRLPLKYWEIAQLIGVTPEHLSRQLKQLRDEGVLERENGSLIIHKSHMLYHSDEF